MIRARKTQYGSVYIFLFARLLICSQRRGPFERNREERQLDLFAKQHSFFLAVALESLALKEKLTAERLAIAA